MPDYPSARFSPNYLSTLSGNFGISQMAGIGSFSLLTWVANLAVYIPFVQITPFVAHRMAIWIATAAGTIHYDIGVYSFSGERMFSTGSITKVSTTQQIQYSTLAADKLIPPGRYYMGFVSDSSTALNVGGGSSGFAVSKLAAGGALEQASAFPLPTVMAATAITHVLYPFVGMTST